MDEWKYIQSSISSIIMNSIPERLQNRICVKEDATVCEMWTKLCSIYGNQSILVQAGLLVQLYLITCPEGGDPLKTIDEVLKKANEVMAAGGKLDGCSPSCDNDKGNAM